MKRKAEGQLDLLSLVAQQAEADLAASSAGAAAQSSPNPEKILVSKRDGSTEPFNKARISIALESAFKAVRDLAADAPMPDAMRDAVGSLTEKISSRLLAETAQGAALDVEYIQDAVENQLMCDGYLTEARRYILYREDRRKIREQKPAAPAIEQPAVMEAVVAAPPVSVVANNDERPVAHQLLKVIYSEAIPDSCGDPIASHRHNFCCAIQDAVHNNLLAPELLTFDLEHLGNALQLHRDQLIARDGLEWLYANCFARERDRCVETPQYFWMRLAMAFAANEVDDKDARALEFYEVLSTLRFLPSEKLLQMTGRSAVISKRIAADIEDIDFTVRVAGHVNIAAHVQNETLDELLLYGTTSSAVRLLDDVVEAMTLKLSATALHARECRDVALGIVGFEKALESSSIPVEDEAAMNFAERAAESVAYYATLASSALAAERDSFPAYGESNWSMSALPFEALNFLQPATGVGSPAIGCCKDWLAVRAAVRQNGMRNAHVLAFTPADIVEKIVSNTSRSASYSTHLKRLVRCKKWVDGKVWITLPDYLSGPDLEQAYLLAQQLGIRPYALPIRVTLSEPLTDAAAATKVLKSIEKSS